MWTPTDIAPPEAWTGRRVTYYKPTGVQSEPEKAERTLELYHIPATVRDDHRVLHCQNLPMEDWEVWGIVNRRVTTRPDTGEVLEDYRGYRDREHSRKPVALPHGVTDIRTEVYLPGPPPLI